MATTGFISPNQRSKAGCQQCRRRKRKCDEIHPRCTGCVERGLPCNWQRLEPSRRLVARRQHQYNKDFTVPEVMRSLVTVFAVPSGSIVQTLLSHFCAASPLWITSGGEQKRDACIPLILPVARRNHLVLNCVLALAAGDLSKYSPPSSGIASLSHGFYGQAVAELHSELNNELASTHSEDDTLLAVLLLCVHEAVNFTNTNRLLPHINAAATLCYNRSFSTAKDARLRGLLFEIFCYIASLASFSHGRNLPLPLALQVFNSPFLSGSQYQGILLGKCSKTFCFILQVAMLTNNMDPNDLLDETKASELRSIEAQLADPLIHEPASHGSQAVDERTTAQLYRLACLIHVRRTIEPDLDPKDPVLQEPVTQFIKHLDMLPSTSPANGILCWPLVVAAKDGKVRLAPPLPDANWDPTPLSTEGEDDEPKWTELQLASRIGDLARVKEILSACDSVSQRLEVVNQLPVGYYGQTALQAAAMRGHYPVAQTLIEAGADVNAAGGNNIHRNAFEFACGTGNLLLIRLLLGAGGIVDPKRVTRYNGRTPLQAAAEGGHEEVVLLLLDLGASINSPASPSSGVTALQAACFQGHTKLAKLLIARGADVNAAPGKSNGYTALQGACLGGEEIIVRLLLDSGADIDAPGSPYHGGTALHAAVSRGNIKLVNMLLSANANPNSQAGHRRQTPLQSAYLIGRQDIVAVLRASGATGALAGGRFLFDNGRIRNLVENDVGGPSVPE